MYEIRNYHFDPERIDQYKTWAKTVALPHLKSKMDVVGFWISDDTPAEYGGRLPRDAYGPPANVTWIIRWQDKNQRDAAWAELRASDEWKTIFGQVPGGPASYARTEAIFASEL